MTDNTKNFSQRYTVQDAITGLIATFSLRADAFQFLQDNETRYYTATVFDRMAKQGSAQEWQWNGHKIIVLKRKDAA